MERWIALDVETTGLSPTRHEIRELAAVPFGIDGDSTERVLHFTPGDAQRIARPPLRARIVELLQHIGDGAVFVAHNAVFDLAFLSEALRHARLSFRLRAYCTLRLARTLLPDLPRYDLASICAAFGIEVQNRHAALGDARAVAALFAALVRKEGFANEQAIRRVHGPPIQVRASWGLG